MSTGIASALASPLASPKRRIDHLPPITTDLAEAKRHLTEYGLARVSGVLSPQEIVAARTRLFEQAEAEREMGIAELDSAADPSQVGPNQRVRNLINKGEIFRRFAVNPKALEMVRFLLGPHALLSSYSANIAGKDGVRMFMHTDQFYAGSMPFAVGSAVVWMLDDFTAQNGATVVVPGSHRWTSMTDVDQAAVASPIPATGPAGAILMMDGRTLHATGSNTTDRPRPGLITYWAKPFIRQEENFALSLAPQVMQKCSRELLALLGFQTYIGLGGIDGSKHATPLTSRPTSFSGEWRPRRLSQSTKADAFAP
jgi:ectoine hydroxylase-related dioxygenase (phytanoyl-CoA dioxygenase family)